MSDKVERDYKDFDSQIEKLTNEEIQKIKKRTKALKMEAEKVGETVEELIAENEGQMEKKKS